MDRISEAVKNAGLVVALGVTEREAFGWTLYFSILYFNKDGRIAGKHCKLKPTGLERYVLAEGDGSTLLSFDTDIGEIGSLICWENYMPLARTSMLYIPDKVYQHSALKVYHVFRMKPYQWLQFYNTLDVCNYYQY